MPSNGTYGANKEIDSKTTMYYDKNGENEGNHLNRYDSHGDGCLGKMPKAPVLPSTRSRCLSLETAAATNPAGEDDKTTHLRPLFVVFCRIRGTDTVIFLEPKHGCGSPPRCHILLVVAKEPPAYKVTDIC